MDYKRRFQFSIAQFIVAIALSAVVIRVVSISISKKVFEIGERHVLVTQCQGHIDRDEKQPFFNVSPVESDSGSLVFIEESCQLENSIGARRFFLAVALPDRLKTGDIARISSVSRNEVEEVLGVGMMIAWESTNYPPHNLWFPENTTGQIRVISRNANFVRCQFEFRFETDDSQFFDFSRTLELELVSSSTPVRLMPWRVKRRSGEFR